MFLTSSLFIIGPSYDDWPEIHLIRSNMFRLWSLFSYIYIYIFSQIQQITKAYNQKHLESSWVNLISNQHGTCVVFPKNTLPDQPKPAVFYGIPKIHKLPEVIKTVMECRNIINENLSDQTSIDIAMEHNILPPFRPIISGIGCLAKNMSAYVEKILRPFLQKIPNYIQDNTQFLKCI